MKARGRADTEIRRTSSPGHFGLVLSVFVLCLQLVAPGLHSSLLGSRTSNGDLSSRLGGHALCLGATPDSSAGEPASPAQPSEDHHDFASCCLWHSNNSPPVPRVATGLLRHWGLQYLDRTGRRILGARQSPCFCHGWEVRRLHDVFFVQPGDAKPRAKRGVVRQRGVYTGINRVLPDRRLVGPCRGHSDQSLTRTLMDGADDAGGRESSIAAYLHRRK